MGCCNRVAQIFPFCFRTSADSEPNLPVSVWKEECGQVWVPTLSQLTALASRLPGPYFSPCHVRGQEVTGEGDMVHDPCQRERFVILSSSYRAPPRAQRVPSCDQKGGRFLQMFRSSDERLLVDGRSGWGSFKLHHGSGTLGFPADSFPALRVPDCQQTCVSPRKARSRQNPLRQPPFQVA